MHQLADLACMPSKERKFFFERVRDEVRTARDLDRLARGSLATKKGASLLRAALTLYEELSNLKSNERKLLNPHSPDAR